MSIYSAPKSSIENVETPDVNVRKWIVKAIMVVSAFAMFVPGLTSYQAVNLYGPTEGKVGFYGLAHLIVSGGYALSYLIPLFLQRIFLLAPLFLSCFVVALNWWFVNGELGFIIEYSWYTVLAPVVFWFLFGKPKQYA